jgi:hypothetical protein
VSTNACVKWKDALTSHSHHSMANIKKYVRTRVLTPGSF